MADDNLLNAVSPTEAANSASNPFYHVLSDGTNPLSVTGGVLDVNATVVLDTAYVDDSAFVVGTDEVNAQGFLFDDTATDTVDEGDIGLARMTADRMQLNVIADPTTPSQRLAVNADGSINTTATVTLETAYADNSTEFTIDTSDVNAQGFLVDETAFAATVTEGRIGLARMTANRIMLTTLEDADGDRIAINSNGSINTVPAIASSGSEVHDFDQSPATALNSSDNHDYTVANTTFLFQQVTLSGAGRQRVEVQTGPLAGLVTSYVLFKEGEKTLRHKFNPAIPVPVGGTGTVRLIRTQRSLGSLFMYSTISGEDI